MSVGCDNCMTMTGQWHGLLLCTCILIQAARILSLVCPVSTRLFAAAAASSICRSSSWRCRYLRTVTTDPITNGILSTTCWFLARLPLVPLFRIFFLLKTKRWHKANRSTFRSAANPPVSGIIYRTEEWISKITFRSPSTDGCYQWRSITYSERSLDSRVNPPTSKLRHLTHNMCPAARLYSPHQPTNC